jgi:sulfonate transport system substrate-binding protein
MSWPEEKLETRSRLQLFLCYCYEVTSTILYWVGEEQGFFEEQGIKLNYVGAVPSGQLVASVVAGKIDVGGAHVNRTIAGISAGAKIKAVVAQSETTKEIPHHTYITRKNSPIKGPQDVVGKKNGIATYGAMSIYHMGICV